jgi:hypothetical protein
MTANVVRLNDKRDPVLYSVHITQHWDGGVDVFVQDVADDEQSRKAVAYALRRAADGIDGGKND